MTKTRGTEKKIQNALVLQGGGALGAYQGGVYQVLAEQGYEPDWVVGTSIGAINAVLIAGNPPELRLQRLREFWALVSHPDPLDQPGLALLLPWLQAWSRAGIYLDTLSRGVPGFFVPRPGATLNIEQSVPTPEAGFYDTSPLRETLLDLVDFKYLKTSPVRCTVCAVEVTSGKLKIFDSAEEELGPEHIMASGALPPGFPPVMVGNKAYWDGGIYSNTPADVVMADAERRDTLCFMVDLWDPTEAAPRSISDAITRQKDIQYASRTREHLDDHRRMQNMRRAIELLSARLPPAQRKDPLVHRLAALGCHSSIQVVRLIMKALPDDDFNKDVDFTESTLQARWQAGCRDAGRALRHRSWLEPLPDDIGMMIHELPQEGEESPA